MSAQKIKAASMEAASKTTLACAHDVTASGPDHTRNPQKWERVLQALAAGKSFNRFESERQLSDHCLHSTISAIQRRGVTVFREFETVPGYLGCPTRVCRYWLDRSPENLKRAFALLPSTQGGV